MDKDQESVRSEAAVNEALKWHHAIVDLASGWDEHGAIGPKGPYTWETVARMAMDYAQAGLRAAASKTALVWGSPIHEVEHKENARLAAKKALLSPARVAEGEPAITEEKIGDLLAELEILNFMDVGAPRHHRKKEYEHIREFLISLAPGVVEPNFEKAKK